MRNQMDGERVQVMMYQKAGETDREGGRESEGAREKGALQGARRLTPPCLACLVRCLSTAYEVSEGEREGESAREGEREGEREGASESEG